MSAGEPLLPAVRAVGGPASLLAYGDFRAYRG